MFRFLGMAVVEFGSKCRERMDFPVAELIGQTTDFRLEDFRSEGMDFLVQKLIEFDLTMSWRASARYWGILLVRHWSCW